jgi:FkbM family methyltransferase
VIFFLKLIKILTPPIIWDSFKGFRNIFKKYYSLNNLDKKIEKYLNYRNGFFVELGANDGVNQSNTLYFERYKNWKGLLIEPYLPNYLKCIKNRSKKNYIFCNACVSFNYKKTFVKLLYNNLITIPVGVETDLKAQDYMGNKHDHPFVFGAQAITLNKILLKSNAPKNIDLLSLDVEGAEMEVLKGINHNIFRFKFICVEARNIKKLKKYLNSFNYELKEKLSSGDYLFSDKSTNKVV